MKAPLNRRKLIQRRIDEQMGASLISKLIYQLYILLLILTEKGLDVSICPSAC